MNEDKKAAIEAFNYLPIERLQDALTAKKNGCNKNMCAAAAGLSREDLDYMIELGREGIPPWDEFFKLWRRSEYLAAAPVWEKVQEEAIDGNDRQIERFLSNNDEEYAEKKEAREKPSNGERQQIGGFTVNINKFAPPEEKKQLPDVIDVSPKEIS